MTQGNSASSISASELRRQKAFLEREERILGAALELLGQEGYLGVTMERIARKIAYSKGTIYQHFSCKEEIFYCLAIRVANQLAGLFDRIFNSDLPTRYKMLGTADAYCLHARLHPVEFVHLSTIKSPSIAAKVSPERREELTRIEAGLMQQFVDMVATAQAQGDLPRDLAMSPQELAVAVWSSMYGMLVLEFQYQHSDLSHLGVETISSGYYKTLDVLLDGLGWSPLSNDYDRSIELSRIRNTFFTHELQKLTGAEQ